MIETLASSVASGNEEDYVIAMDLCEQEGWAADMDGAAAGPWGANSSRSRFIIGRDQHAERSVFGRNRGHCATIGLKCGSVSDRNGRVSGRGSLGSRGPRWSARWPDDS